MTKKLNARSNNWPFNLEGGDILFKIASGGEIGYEEGGEVLVPQALACFQVLTV